MLVLLLRLMSLGVVVASFMHSGTPGGVPASADCAIRKFAYEYGQKLAPQRGDFKTLYDALQLQNCDVMEPTEMDIWNPPTYNLKELEGTVLYVDGKKGHDDLGRGNINAPFQTIHLAVSVSRSVQKPCSIILREGTHLLESTIQLGPQDSGLTFRNYPGERAIISGGIPLKTNWKSSTACKGCYEADLHGQVDSVLGLRRNGIREIRARYPNFDPEVDSVIDGKILFHDGHTGWISKRTVWVENGPGMNGHSPWPPTEKAKTYVMAAADWPGVEWPMTLYKSTWTGEGDWGEYWLGVGGTCVDRDPPVGYWCAPGAPRRISVPNHPSGMKPDSSHLPNLPYANATGAVIHTWRPGHWYTNMFEVGSADHHVINTTVWTTHMNENNIYGRVPVAGQDAGTIKYLGAFSTIAECQHAVNTSRKGPFHSYTWHQPNFGGDFASQCYGDTSTSWNPTKQENVDSGRGPSHSQYYQFNFSWGGFQGGEGVTQSESWYIENVLEELDIGREWYFNDVTKILYYMPNGTGAPTGEFVATNHKILFNIVGTQAKPATHVAIKGLTLQDTSYTYMDPHGLPSGGDWALQRQGAITLIGTKNIVVDGCLFSRLDGNAVFIGGYNRNMTISNNEFVYIGDSALAAWGDTSYELNKNKSITVDYKVGPDGRNGDQPRGTQILNNICHEIGLWQKQSSFWFQAVTAQTVLKGNIFFNGPRAAVNFNDGFGGGDELTENLLINTCRESSDHGPWNSWDRVPYITNLRHGSGKPSIIPATRDLHHNFIIGTYNSQEQIDTDDGSAYFETHHNFLTYADNGLKSDFGGHDHVWHDNVVAYTGSCWGVWNFYGYNDGFYNNKCVFRSGSGYHSDCNMATGWVIHSNQVYSSSGKLNACGTTLKNWVSQGHDKGTTIGKWPSDDELIGWGRALLM